MECKVCPKGYYTNDQVSSDKILRLDRCQECQRGTYGDQKKQETKEECKDCMAGRYNDIEGLPKDFDQVCNACVPGKYSTEEGNTKDSNCINCGSGTFSSIQAATSSAACKLCSVGKYSADVGVADESLCKACELGFEQEEKGKAYCLPCTPGKFGEMNNGVHVCTLCPENTFSSVSKQQMLCNNCARGRTSSVGAVTCLLCPVGQYVDGDGCTICEIGKYQSKMEQATCVSCKMGTVSNKKGASLCLACLPGRYQSHVGKKKCIDCAVNYFAHNTSQTLCLECPHGRTSPIGSAVCSTCSTGRRMKKGNDVNDFTCLECENGKISQAGDVECSNCTAGFFQQSKGKGFCHSCESGTWSDTIGSSSSSNCQKCLRGTFSTATAASSIHSCNTCPPGKKSQVLGANNSQVCVPCEIGKASGSGAIVCTNCVAGKYQNTRGNGNCISCMPGTRNVLEGSTECLECTAGRASKTSNNDQLKCDTCVPGRYQSSNGQTTCLSCQPGRYTNEFGASICKNCAKNYFAMASRSSLCIPCLKGRYTASTGQSDCVSCAAGRYGTNASIDLSELISQERCEKCPLGYKRAEEDEDLTYCLTCKLGETTNIQGATSCSACGIGLYGSIPGNCSQCPLGQYQSDKKQITCLTCKGGRIPNDRGTSCSVPPYRVKHDCDFSKQYLDDISPNRDDHECKSCPLGASCYGNIGWSEVVALQGWWRVPWSINNRTFKQCPFQDDCIGVKSTTTSGFNITEGCLNGTNGALCSICIENYHRDGSSCNVCYISSVPSRVGILVAVFAVLSAIVVHCRRRLRRKWKKYKPLWRDLLSVISINITFAQINSSLPSILEIQWPASWRRFVQHFAFVNIDLMSLIGISCIGDYNYYVSFGIMVCLPVSIVVLTATNFYWVNTSMKRRLRTLTDTEKTTMEEEALHALFHLADADHSGEVDSAELCGILKQLNWKVSVKSAHAIIETICEIPNDHGLFVLNETQFLDAMISGSMKLILEQKKQHFLDQMFAKQKSPRKKKSKRNSLANRIVRKTSTILSGRDQLIQWTLKKSIVANSLSGATQLLLLSHTPVSRKVFQYFDCNDIAGKYLLRADYDIECDSNYYWQFSLAVGFVLINFTIALPGVISYYLIRHRNELYSTSVSQTIGWLYDPFVRGAEFWQVHDVLMKMILTGMLIYIPSTSRAGIAVLVCIVACCNLNYFEPHKNKVLFWLTQISFATTASKYVVALLLSVNNSMESTDAENEKEQQIIGTLLIVLDAFFLVSSVFAIFGSICVLRNRLNKIRENDSIRNDIQSIVSATRALAHDNTHVVPIRSSSGTLVEKEDEPEDVSIHSDNNGAGTLVEKEDEPGDVSIHSDNNGAGTLVEKEDEPGDDTTTNQSDPLEETRRSSVTRARSERSQIVHDINEEHRQSQMNLDANIQMKARKQKRKTQLRVKARLKIRQTKALTRIPMFKKLKPEAIDSILEFTTYKRYVKDDVMCTQGDVALDFSIIVTGQCAVKVRGRSGEEGDSRRVGTLKELDFFGESCLLGGDDVHEGVRNATVIAESEYVQVLKLSRENFELLIQNGILSSEIISIFAKEEQKRKEATRKSMMNEPIVKVGGDDGDGSVKEDVYSTVQ